MHTETPSTPISNLFNAEFNKYKGTFLLRMAIFAPLVIVLLYFAAGVFRGTRFLDPDSDVWMIYAFRINSPGFGFFYPLHLILLAALLAQMEHQHTMWKHLFVQPVPRVRLYIVKWLGFTAITALSTVIFLAAIFITGTVLGWIQPEIGLGYPKHVVRTCWMAIAAWISATGILGIQYMISMLWKNVAIPLSVGIAVFVLAFLLANGWEYAEYHPYFYPNVVVTNLQTQPDVWWTKHMSLGIGVGVMATAIGGFLFLRRKID